MSEPMGTQLRSRPRAAGTVQFAQSETPSRSNGASLSDGEQGTLVPHSTEAEEAVLGSILIDPECLPAVIETGLEAADFFLVSNAWIYEVMLDLERVSSASRVAIDITLVSNHLAQRGQLGQLSGGNGYLVMLLEAVPSAVNAVAYANIVLAAAVRRRMIRAAHEIIKTAQEQEADSPTALFDIGAKVYDDARRQVGKATRLSYYQAASTQYDNIKRISDLRAQGINPLLSTGLSTLDTKLGGGLVPESGELVFIIGHAGRGKSILMKDIAMAAGLAGMGVEIFSLEMRHSQSLRRVLHPAVSSEKQKTGLLEPEDWSNLLPAIETMKGLPIHIDDDPYLSPQILRSKLRRIRREKNVKLVIIDYLQLMQSGVVTRDLNYAIETEMIGRALKRTAAEFGVIMIVASGVTRTDGRVSARQMRGGEGSVHHGDIILALNESAESTSTIVPGNFPLIDVDVEKSRDGETGRLKLVLNTKELKLYPTELVRVQLPPAYP